MKKKHRDITVNTIKYGWIAEPHTINGMVELRVYKDKKVWFKTNFLGVIKPQDVRDHIVAKLNTSNTTTVSPAAPITPTTRDTTKFAVKVNKPTQSMPPLKLDMFKKKTTNVKITSEWKVVKG